MFTCEFQRHVPTGQADVQPFLSCNGSSRVSRNGFIGVPGDRFLALGHYEGWV
jgi:hypothetical protein